MKKENAMVNKFKIILIFTLIVSFIVLPGAGLARNKPKVNAETNVIYDYYELSELSKYFSDGYDYVEGKCNNMAVSVKGTVKSVDSKSKIIAISSADNPGISINVLCKNKELLSRYRAGDTVTVYGLISKKSIVDNNVVIEADGIASGMSNQKMDYLFSDGTFYLDSGSAERQIAGGKIRYRIPDEWETVEAGGEDKADFFNIDLSDGNCYYLNSLKGKDTAECFCIFYFSNDKYLKYDTDKSQMAGIERAIISNICQSEKSKLSYKNITHYTFPTDSVKTSYGLDYDAYVANYKTHRAEFIFVPAESGVCVLLYVYNDDYSSYKDILYLMRTLNVKN